MLWINFGIRSWLRCVVDVSSSAFDSFFFCCMRNKTLRFFFCNFKFANIRLIFKTVFYTIARFLLLGVCLCLITKERIVHM